MGCHAIECSECWDQRKDEHRGGQDADADQCDDAERGCDEPDDCEGDDLSEEVRERDVGNAHGASGSVQ